MSEAVKVSLDIRRVLPRHARKHCRREGSTDHARSSEQRLLAWRQVRDALLHQRYQRRWQEVAHLADFAPQVMDPRLLDESIIVFERV